MGDRRFDRDEIRRPRRDDPERELTLGEAIDLSVRKVVTAIVIAGGLIALGAYTGGSSYSGPRYQITAADGRLYRVNTDSGTVIACEGERCTIVLQHGQDLVEHLPDLPRPPAVAPPPAPGPQPAAAPARLPPPAAPQPQAPAQTPAR